MRLFCDCKTDEEKSNFFLSGRAVETGVIAPAISNDVAMAYHRCAEFKKEIDALRAKIAEMEKQGPVAHVWRCDNGHVHGSCESELLMGQQLYALPGAQPEPSVPYGAIAKILTEVMDIATANGADSRSMPDEYVEVAAWLCGVPGAKGE